MSVEQQPLGPSKAITESPPDVAPAAPAAPMETPTGGGPQQLDSLTLDRPRPPMERRPSSSSRKEEPPAEEQALNAKEEWWEAKKAEEASQRASDAPVTTVAASDFGGTDYVSEAGGAQAQRSPRKPAGDGSAGGALNPRNMTTGQLKRELRARGVEPADDATRDVLRDTLVGLLGQERI